MLKDFWTWLLTEAQRQTIEPAVMRGYEHAFKAELHRLIARTQDPILRAKFKEMLNCPIRTSRGQCLSFTDYVVGALIKHGVHRQYDMEQALAYVFEKMMMDKTDAGEPRTTVFGGFDEDRPQAMHGNPLQARFMKFLHFAVKNIARGKIPRLSSVEARPQGTISIGQGRRKEGDPSTGISPDEIASRPSADADLSEMIEDITSLLLRKQSETGLPLARVFRAMMNGMTSDQQRARFGDRPTRESRRIIVQTIRDYAEKTGNYRLLHLLGQFEGFRSNKSMPTSKRREKVSQPKLSDKERDYRSIASVIARFDHPVGTAQLGSFRRRWLEYPPRDPSSGYRNRLEEVLSAMVRDGVLRAIPTRQGATVFASGPHFDDYRAGPSV